jgi:hypothetical protein
MTAISFQDEAEIYDVMSKLASRAALSSAVQTIALIQKAMSENPKGDKIMALAGDSILSDREAAVLGAFDNDVLNKAWKKVIKTVDLAISFVPELDRIARTEAVLIRKGDKIVGVDAQGFPGVLANWEVEIDFGVIRGKVSW